MRSRELVRVNSVECSSTWLVHTDRSLCGRLRQHFRIPSVTAD